MLSLKFTKRNKGESKDGSLKAVYYSGKEESQMIAVDAIEFAKMYREAGQSALITLDGEGKKLQAIVKDVDYHPVKYEPIHVDFYIVEKGSKIDAHIPFEFIGEEDVKVTNGTLVKVMHELHIEAPSDKLPHVIEVDVSSLVDLDSAIKVKDLKLPEGVTVYHVEEDAIVAAISEVVEEDLSAPVEGDIEDIEVEEKGKKEEEDGEEEDKKEKE